MIVRRLVVLLVMLFASALLAGCGASVTVLKQASPNPFVGQTQFALERMETKGLQVGDLSEERYLAEKDESQRASFAGDKEAIQNRFDAALTEAARDAGLTVGAAGQAPFVIKPRLVFVEPGYYAVVASGASQATIVGADHEGGRDGARRDRGDQPDRLVERHQHRRHQHQPVERRPPARRRPCDRRGGGRVPRRARRKMSRLGASGGGAHRRCARPVVGRRRAGRHRRRRRA
jgi:hypothetical protein